MTDEVKDAVTVPISPTIKEVANRAEFDAALAAAPGAVLVDFSAADCAACEEEKPLLQQLLQQCAGAASNPTVILVDEAKMGPELANEYDVSATPTLLYAKSAADFTAKKVKEFEPDDAALKRKLKCAR